jgi:ligand-binding sensor domain-containing protein
MKNSNSTARRRVAAIFVIVAVVIASQNFNIHAASMSGSTFTSANRTITIMAGDDRYLWAGTCGEGLLRIDKSSGETVLYASSNSGLNGSCIRALVFDKDGALLVGTAGAGIVRFNGAKWERLSGLADSNVRGITVDSQGAIWAWMQNLGIVRLNAGTWQPVVNRFGGVLTRNPAGNVWAMNVPLSGSPDCDGGWINEYVSGGLQSTISLAPVCSEITYPQLLAVDNKKNCWIGVPNLLIKITNHSVDRFPLNRDTTQHKSITALAVDFNGRLLIATTDYSGTCEVFIHDQINGKGQPFDSCTFTFNARYITAACADPAINGFWCAASDGRIIKIDMFNQPAVFTTGNSVLPSNSIASLLIDTSDNLWVATNKGIARCDDTAWTLYPAMGDSMPGLDVSSLALDSSGIIWAGFWQSPVSSMSISGISCFSGGRWRQLTRDHISVKAITFDKNGNQWVVSDGGVYRWRNSQFEQFFETKYSSVAEIALGTAVNAIAFDSANIPWIGTGLGIKRYENNVWIDDSTIIPFLPQSGISTIGVNVSTLCFSHGALWIGTACGLIKCTGSACVRMDTAGSLLPDLNVQCIAVDGPDSAWIGTTRGLVRLAGQNHETYTSGNSPLTDNDITACAAAPSGDVWIGTRLGGLTVLRQTATATIPGAVSKATPGMQPIDISVHTLRPHTCRVSIRTNTPAAIGFSVISLQGKLIKRFAATPAKVQTVTFTWNGTDRSNRPVADGMYLGIVTVNGKTVKSTIVPRRL